MTVGSWVRRTGFWTIDRMRGGPVHRHFEDIRAAMERGGADPAVLQGMLEHATRTTPAYEPYTGCALTEFPVLERGTLKRGAALYRSRAGGPGDMIERHTSGSSGSPLVIGQDAEKRRRAIADAIYFNELGGQRVGDRLLWLLARPGSSPSHAGRDSSRTSSRWTMWAWTSGAWRPSSGPSAGPGSTASSPSHRPLLRWRATWSARARRPLT